MDSHSVLAFSKPPTIWGRKNRQRARRAPWGPAPLPSTEVSARPKMELAELVHLRPAARGWPGASTSSLSARTLRSGSSCGDVGTALAGMTQSDRCFLTEALWLLRTAAETAPPGAPMGCAARPRPGPVEGAEGTRGARLCLGPAGATVGLSAASEPGLLTGRSLAARLQTPAPALRTPAGLTQADSPNASLPLLTWASGAAHSQVPTASGAPAPRGGHGR